MAYEVIIEGNYFKSISAAAKHANVSFKTMRNRITSGCPDEDLLKPIQRNYGNSTKAIPITINGLEFKSYSEAARFYNVTYSTFRLWVKMAVNGNGEMYVCETDRTFRPGNPIVIDNILYISWVQAAYSLGVYYSTFVTRVKRGYYEDGYDRTKRHSGKPITVHGTKYESVASCANAHGLSPSLLHARLQKGFSVEDAVDNVRYKTALAKANQQKQEQEAKRTKQAQIRASRRAEAEDRFGGSGMKCISQGILIKPLEIASDFNWD